MDPITIFSRNLTHWALGHQETIKQVLEGARPPASADEEMKAQLAARLGDQLRVRRPALGPVRVAVLMPDGKLRKGRKLRVRLALTGGEPALVTLNPRPVRDSPPPVGELRGREVVAEL